MQDNNALILYNYFKKIPQKENLKTLWSFDMTLWVAVSIVVDAYMLYKQKVVGSNPILKSRRLKIWKIKRLGKGAISDTKFFQKQIKMARQGSWKTSQCESLML